MQKPLFYIEAAPSQGIELELSEENSRHISSVLRMQEEELLQLTDGRGNLYEGAIVKAHKKRTSVRIIDKTFHEQATVHITVAIALLKNAARFEWFLEKATELGIRTIIPLITARTEKQHYKEERFRAILVSAMMQSGQTWLPQLLPPQPFGTYIPSMERTPDQAIFIAHCMESPKEDLSNALLSVTGKRLILIGPEGDFTPDEVQSATEHGAAAVSLGDTRLRAETAGIVAATLLKLVNRPFAR